MSALALLLACLLGLPLQAQPAAPGPKVLHTGEAPATEGAAAGEHAPSAGEMFIGLFKHLEPHAVAALWFGGTAGSGFVTDYPVDAAGQPLAMEHGKPVTFHSRAELQAYYEGKRGGGFGLLILNINLVQWMAGAVLLLLSLTAARAARQLAGNAPRGRFLHVIESVVLYVRDDMVYAVMGQERGRAFVPFFLTQFSFILMMNLFGLLWLPGGLGATATANIAVTAGMALTTLFVIHASGIKEHGFFHHWKNFVPHGVPWFVLPIIIPVEIIGMLVKPAALTVRLFANMLAGHLVMLSFFGLVYVFGLYALPALAMAFAISVLELFVCFVQAYIFTYLSIIFVGASVHPEH